MINFSLLTFDKNITSLTFLCFGSFSQTCKIKNLPKTTFCVNQALSLGENLDMDLRAVDFDWPKGGARGLIVVRQCVCVRITY